VGLPGLGLPRPALPIGGGAGRPAGAAARAGIPAGIPTGAGGRVPGGGAIGLVAKLELTVVTAEAIVAVVAGAAPGAGLAAPAGGIM
jgi:hypothetical protein